jgi:hypothetical protein
MRILLLSAALASLALTAAATSAASPDAAPGSWTLRTFDVYEPEDLRKPVEQRRIRYSGVIAHTSDAAGPGALFSCSGQHGLSVMFSLEGVDFADEEWFASSNQVRGLTGRFIVDGKRPLESTRFFYRPRLKVVQPARSAIAFEAVDAVYLRKQTEVAMGGLQSVSLNMPAPDDTFLAFIAACPSFAAE